MLSAAVFLRLDSAGKPICHSGNPPSFRDFHERIWAGEIDLTDNNLKVVHGLVHWKKLLEAVREPRLTEALEIVSERNRSLEAQRARLRAAK